MAKNFPVSAGIHRFLGYPETKTIYSIIDEQFLWISIARHFEFPKIGHGLPSFLVFIGFHGLPRWRNPWKLKCQSTDGFVYILI